MKFGTFIFLVILATGGFFGFLYLKDNSSSGIRFSYFSSDEFKSRITFVLTFIEQHYPAEFELIDSNISIIKAQEEGNNLNIGHSSGASYARTGRKRSAADYGLIALMPVEGHCPPSLIKNKFQTINCAGVIYYEALHHYFSNNHMYESNPHLEHYNVYKRHYLFVKKMGGEKSTQLWLYEQMNKFKDLASEKPPPKPR